MLIKTIGMIDDAACAVLGLHGEAGGQVCVQTLESITRLWRAVVEDRITIRAVLAIGHQSYGANHIPFGFLLEEGAYAVARAHLLFQGVADLCVPRLGGYQRNERETTAQQDARPARHETGSAVWLC